VEIKGKERREKVTRTDRYGRRQLVRENEEIKK
jgi:hypothetical protein